SISSMKTMQGACFFACSNMSRTRLAPTPTNISTKTEPEIVKNVTFASPAHERASKALLVPTRPTSHTPFGTRPPTRRNFFQPLVHLLIELGVADRGGVLVCSRALEHVEQGNQQQRDDDPEGKISKIVHD